MKRLVFFMGVIMLIGCISKVVAIPRKSLIYGQNSVSTNTYNPIQETDNTLHVTGSTSTAALFTDSRYDGYDSTGTFGTSISTGLISNTPTGIITGWFFYTQGGDATISFSKQRSGILPIYEGIPEHEPNLAIPLDEGNIDITIESLTSGATLTYGINGGN